MAIANEGLFRFSGRYGTAWQDGVMLAEVVDATGAVTIGKIEVPLAGKRKQGTKPGGETREGTFRVQKVDTKWEMLVYSYLSQSDDVRRANRDAGRPSISPFSVILDWDDPDALGVEQWQLDGIMLWNLPLGFSTADDLTEREYTFTWESEHPIYAFKAATGPGGAPVAHYLDGLSP